MGNIYRHNFNKQFSKEAIKSIVEQSECIALHVEDGYYAHAQIYAPTQKAWRTYREQYNALAMSHNIPEIAENDILKHPPQDYKGWVFYAEYANKTMKKKDVAYSHKLKRDTLQYTNGNVIAVFPEQKNLDYSMMCISTLMSNPESNTAMLASGSCSSEYLRDYGKHISLEQAMRLHPNMFLLGYFNVEE